MRCKLRLVTENGDKAPRKSFARGVMAQVGRDPAVGKIFGSSRMPNQIRLRRGRVVSSLKAVCERLI
ncbi:hypothetical protein OKW46_002528 [Paraburkholderia sp. WSM4179]|uniref:hypothetical protein n=1 Tax=Paraburkholderia sp. WSM4179 TaxID=2991073 RepID=UPI002476CDE0|nr:hypothetical protein [Paraburkholderia sp. WSM4179]MDH6148603.1 hypothetical protein [Paraburkholderia sp. WSM4179]